MDVCCIPEVRWKKYGAQFLGVDKRRHKLGLSGNESRISGVGIFGKRRVVCRICGSLKKRYNYDDGFNAWIRYCESDMSIWSAEWENNGRKAANLL